MCHNKHNIYMTIVKTKDSTSTPYDAQSTDDKYK